MCYIVCSPIHNILLLLEDSLTSPTRTKFISILPELTDIEIVNTMIITDDELMEEYIIFANHS